MQNVFYILLNYLISLLDHIYKNSVNTIVIVSSFRNDLYDKKYRLIYYLRKRQFLNKMMFYKQWKISDVTVIFRGCKFLRKLTNP